VDDDDGDDDKGGVDDSLDMPLLDPSDLHPLSSHTSTALSSELHHPHISKHGTKLKMKLSKSNSSLVDAAPPYYPTSASQSAAASLAFTHHPASLLSLLTKSTATLDGEDLKALAKDLHALQRESKHRALLIEAELRKLYDVTGDGAGGGIEGEEYYQNAIKWLHGIDVSDDVLGSDDAAAGGAVVEQRRKKHGKKGDDDDDTADGTKRKNKKKKSSQSAAAADGDEDEEVDSEDESKPKKAMTAKEKQTALKEFWETVDGWMAFPTIEQCDSVRESEWRGVEIGAPNGYWMKDTREREWREERERERDREREKEKEKEREKDRADAHKDAKKRKKEKKKEKERRERERERDKHKDAKKLAEANRLSLFFIDDPKTRRSVIDTDRTLSGINGTSNGNSSGGGGSGGGGGGSSGLVSRVMSVFLEQAGKVTPYINPAVKGKAAGSAGKKQKKDNNKQRASITPPQFTLEERLRMELKSVGLLSGADVDLAADYAHRADDEVCAALRSHSTSLSHAVASNNTVRRMLHPLSLRLVDHTQRLQQLYEAEAALHKYWKKKKLSDNKCKEVVEQFVTQQQRLGSRRRITGFIPHPQDMKGVPRVIANSVLSHPSYRDVLMSDELPPLQSGGGAGHYYGGRYGKGAGAGSGLLPPSTLPSLLSHLSSAGYSPGGSHGYFTSSPLPSFSSHNSPLHLSPSGSPVRPAEVGEDGAVSANGPSTPQPLELYSPNISIGQLPNLAQDTNGDNAFAFGE